MARGAGIFSRRDEGSYGSPPVRPRERCDWDKRGWAAGRPCAIVISRDLTFDRDPALDNFKRRRFFARGALPAGSLSLMLCIGPGVSAASSDEAELARQLRLQGVILPLEDLLRRAQALRPGSLIDARLHHEREHDTYVYEIRMLDRNGVLWEVEFDASSGEMLEVEPEDP